MTQLQYPYTLFVNRHSVYKCISQQYRLNYCSKIRNVIGCVLLQSVTDFGHTHRWINMISDVPRREEIFAYCLYNIHVSGDFFQFFHKNGQPTIVTKDRSWQSRIGTATDFSFADIRLANIIYNCGGEDFLSAWWRHQMETFSASLAICAGYSPVPDEFPEQRPVTRSFDVFLDPSLNKRLSKHSRGWWFETLSGPLWRQSYGRRSPWGQ